jgi:hypothetical protein
MLVEGLGDLKVFACNAAKKPLVKKWQKNAKPVEPPKHWPLVGVPTGAINNFFVVDLELEGLNWLARNPLPETMRNKTPRGWHYLFKAVEGLRGSADLRIHDGVHIRANGNYVIWWPRQFLRFDEAPLADCPEGLLALARKDVPAHSKETARLERVCDGASINELQSHCAPLVSRNCREGRYALAAVKNAYRDLADEWPRYFDADRGMVYAQGRNNELNRLAFKLGRLVVNGWIDIARVVRMLMLAAKSVGLVREDGEAQCHATIMSGLKAGMQWPYHALD